MPQNINILNELNELNSCLAGLKADNIYPVPVGYFENLAEIVLKRIKAIEATNAIDELLHLSPFLSKLAKETPYKIPGQYFENLSPVISPDSISVQDELEKLSPLLSGLKKEMPYTIPDGYFENLGTPIRKDKVKVISITQHSWFRMAAAAIVTGVILLAGLQIFSNKNNASGAKPLARFEKDVQKMDDKEKDNLIDFIDAGLSGDESASVESDSKSTDIKELLQGISEDELKEFNSQTQDIKNVLLVN